MFTIGDIAFKWLEAVYINIGLWTSQAKTTAARPKVLFFLRSFVVPLKKKFKLYFHCEDEKLIIK